MPYSIDSWRHFYIYSSGSMFFGVSLFCRCQFSVQYSPFPHHRLRPAWKLSFNQLNFVDPNLRFLTTINGMKMRRVVIIKLHANRNSKES